MKKHNADSAMGRHKSIKKTINYVVFTLLILMILFSGCTKKEVNALSEEEIVVSQQLSDEPAPTESVALSVGPILSEEPSTSAEPTQSGEPVQSVGPAATDSPATSENKTSPPKPVNTESEEVPAKTTEPEKGATMEIKEFTDEPISIEVSRDTATEKLPLPKTLSAINENGDAIKVPVTWTNLTGDTDRQSIDPNDYSSGSKCGYGPWIFTASLGGGYTYPGKPVTASVSIPDCHKISSFCGVTSDGLLLRFVILKGGAVTMPTEVGALMTDGGFKNIPVTWNGSYDSKKAGKYKLTMNIGGSYIGGSATAEIDVMQAADEQGEDQ